MAALAILGMPALARAASLDSMGGHLSVGYSQLFIEGAPSGSFAMGAGLEYPVAPRLGVGIDFGYHLLGTRAEERRSLIAELDYSVFEALVMAHWTPDWPGPVGLISGGLGFFSARADMSTAGPSEFRDLPVEETALGVALGVSLIPRGAIPVRVGFEAATRIIYLPKDTWTLLGGRLVVHY